MKDGLAIPAFCVRIDCDPTPHPINDDVLEHSELIILSALLDIIPLARRTARADDLEDQLGNPLRTCQARAVSDEEDANVPDPIRPCSHADPAFRDDRFHELGMSQPVSPQIVAHRFGAKVMLGTVRRHDDKSTFLALVAPAGLELGFREFLGRERSAGVAGAETKDGSLGRHHSASWWCRLPPRVGDYFRSYFGVSGSRISLKSRLTRLSVVCPSACA